MNYLFRFKMILKRKIDKFGGMAIALIKSFSFREFIIKLSMISSQQKPRICPNSETIQPVIRFVNWNMRGPHHLYFEPPKKKLEDLINYREANNLQTIVAKVVGGSNLLLLFNSKSDKRMNYIERNRRVVPRRFQLIRLNFCLRMSASEPAMH